MHIIWAIKMNFKTWEYFKYNFAIKYIIATYKDSKRKRPNAKRPNGCKNPRLDRTD